MDTRPAARRWLRWTAATLAAGCAAAPSTIHAAGASLALPPTEIPDNLRVDRQASHALSAVDIGRIADAATLNEFQVDGWQSGYDQRLDGAGGTRVLLDSFVFNDSAGARAARAIWTAGTPGTATTIAGLPGSAQAFQQRVVAPGTPGWDVQVIFRMGRVLVNIDARVQGQTIGDEHRARSLALHLSQRYNVWLRTHSP